jgi:hypothetical protein
VFEDMMELMKHSSLLFLLRYPVTNLSYLDCESQYLDAFSEIMIYGLAGQTQDFLALCRRMKFLLRILYLVGLLLPGVLGYDR